MEKIAIASSSPHFTQEHLLFGHGYLLEFEWIERESTWLLHLFDSSENPIALGLKVTNEAPIFVDKTTNVLFLLVATRPNASLNFASLHKDFVLMAEMIDAVI